ncbi:MAG TPA: D-glycerate dehydrogenase [Phycisphaerales bacterium]|nr:D-glycerate dehydrogenase [Phycisphaerales bacterium]
MSEKPLVVVTREVPGEVSVPGARVRMLGAERPPRADVLEAVRGATAVVTMYSDKVDAEFLDAAGPSLRVVSNFAVGFENIDLALCASRGVVVTNTPDAVTEGTADLAWLLVMAVARRLIEADRYARSPEYPARGHLGMTEFLGKDLTGRTLCIVGAGRIGRAVAVRSLAWGMRVLYVARSTHMDFELAPIAASRVTLGEGLARADVVSVHTPLTPETRGLIDARAIALMKPDAILVNTARGPVVDEQALADALARGHLWGAGLDVYEREPVVNPALIPMTNVVLTPHIGSALTRFRREMSRICSENIAAVLAGREPPNRVRAG